MYNFEKITGRIRSDIDRQIADLNAETEREVQELEDRYAQQAEAEYRRIVETGQADAAAQLERLDSMDLLEARKQYLTAKQDLISELFASVLDHLLNMDDAERASVLTQLAVGGSTTGTEELVLSVNDRASIGEGVLEAANLLLAEEGRTAKLTLSNDTRSTRGGLFIRSGNVEANCTFETILRLAQESYASEVAKILFD